MLRKKIRIAISLSLCCVVDPERTARGSRGKENGIAWPESSRWVSKEQEMVDYCNDPSTEHQTDMQAIPIEIRFNQSDRILFELRTFAAHPIAYIY